MQFLNRELCEKLVQSAALAIGHSVLITDGQGRILSSSDKDREGSLHEASLEVIRTGQRAYHNNDSASKLAGTMPGMTIPLFMETEVVGTIGITGSPQDISRYALLIQQMAQIFLTFQSQQQTSAQQASRRQELLRQIITFDKLSQTVSSVQETAYEIGLDLNLPRAVVLVWVDEAVPSVLDHICGYFSHEQDFVCQHSSDEYVVLSHLPEGKMERVKEKCRCLEGELLSSGCRVRIGVGREAASLEELRLSYEDACFAVRAMRAGVRKQGCLGSEDVVLEKLAVGLSGDACREAEHLFSDVLNAKNRDEILDLIECWCRTGFHFLKTAQAMHIHKSTLVYRFRRIHELFGLDLYDFERATALYLLNVRRKLTDDTAIE